MRHLTILIIYYTAGLVSASTNRIGNYHSQYRNIELSLQRRAPDNYFPSIIPRTPGSSLSRYRQNRNSAPTSSPAHDPNVAGSSAQHAETPQQSASQSKPDAVAGISHWGPGKAWTKTGRKTKKVDVPQSDHSNEEAAFTEIVNHPKKASAGGKISDSQRTVNAYNGVSAWSTGTHNSVNLQLNPGSKARIGTYQGDGSRNIVEFDGPGEVVQKFKSNTPGTQMSTAVDLEGGGKVKAKSWN